MWRWFWFVCAVLGALIAPSDASADTVFSQPFNESSSGAESQETTDFTVIAFDDFSLGSAESLTRVDWIGQYGLGTRSDTIHAFTLTFYGDSGGTPSVPLATYTFNDAAHETAYTSPGHPSNLYGTSSLLATDSYFEMLASPFQAAANTHYWLSIVAKMNYPTEWYWAASSVGNGRFYEGNSEFRFSQEGDRAFSLNTSQSATPEPSSLILMGLGLLGTTTLTVARRRARNSLKSRL